MLAVPAAKFERRLGGLTREEMRPVEMAMKRWLGLLT